MTILQKAIKEILENSVSVSHAIEQKRNTRNRF